MIRSSVLAWEVEISILDAEYTFEGDVADALKRQTGLQINLRRRRPMIAYRNFSKKFRAPRGFVRVCDIKAAT